MNIIQCDEDCIYQREGYCSLEVPTVVTNDTGQGCVHRIQASARKRSNPRRTVNEQQPQTLL